jgi:small subunit ribosomal protein S6
MRIYEELFIVKPDAVQEDVDAFVTQMKELITEKGGSVEKEEKWGNRKLAYRVLKFAEGGYILLQFTAEPTTIHELERRMRVNDMVIKFITVRIDEKMKKIEKRRKHREKRAARRPPPPPAPPPAMPGEAPSAVPGAPAPSMPAAPAPAAPEAPVAPVVETPVVETPAVDTVVVETPAADTKGEE